MKRLWLLLVALVVLVLPTTAQEAVTLVPFSDPAYGVEGVLPDGWTKVGPGIYGRGSSDTDPVVLAVQSAPISATELFTAILPQLGLTEIPEPVGITETDALVWTDYLVDVSLPGGTSLTVRVSLAEQAGVTYLVLLQASRDQAEALAEAVFAPVRESLKPLEQAVADLPYIEEEVTFENGDVTLAGTLTLPEGDGPHPAVVLMTGSGQQTRDEIVVPGFLIFKLIADHLTRQGIAVLRYDDRGAGGSTGDYSEATVQELASDGRAAVDYLRARDEINPDQVGILGHSEGGVYAAMLGADPDSGVAFIVSAAGTAVKGIDILKRQNELILGASGMSPAAIDLQMEFLDTAYPLFLARDWQAVEQASYETILAQWETLTPEMQEALGGDAEAYATQTAKVAIAGYASEWFPTMLEYDPAADWAKTSVPVLAVFGALDVQVDDEQNAPTIEAALEAGGNADFEVVVLPDANHLFQAATTGNLEEYGTLPPEFTAEFLPTISEWILERVTVAE